MMEPAILYVDDERANLDVFRRCFDEEFRVLTAADGPAALELLVAGDVGVLVSDQRMQPMAGIELLTRAEARWPSVRRMLLTAYSDRDLLLQARRQAARSSRSIQATRSAGTGGTGTRSLARRSPRA
jgi:CheY-like chemotaxis protein